LRGDEGDDWGIEFVEPGSERLKGKEGKRERGKEDKTENRSNSFSPFNFFPFFPLSKPISPKGSLMNPLTPGEETMIAALARQVKDGDWAACGTLSPMPAAALWLAQLTHAPKAEVFVAGSRDWPFEGEWQGFFDLAQTGRLNVFYLSGAQIDGRGNINLMAVGDYRRPKVRLPGGAGSAILAYVVERVVLFKTSHEPRGLVPQVDVVTAPGYTPQLSSRQRPGKLTCLVTPKCVFKFTPPKPPLLASLHPGTDLEEIKQLTGFEFQVPSDTPATAALSPEARELLYGPVQEKLAGVYPYFAARLAKAENIKKS
jgi:glutaconate CoA-transferase subunit B